MLFVDWILDLEDYFDYWAEVSEEEKVKFVSYKLESDMAKWWDCIQDDSVLR